MFLARGERGRLRALWDGVGRREAGGRAAARYQLGETPLLCSAPPLAD